MDWIKFKSGYDSNANSGRSFLEDLNDARDIAKSLRLSPRKHVKSEQTPNQVYDQDWGGIITDGQSYRIFISSILKRRMEREDPEYLADHPDFH